MGAASTADGRLESCARGGKTREHPDDVTRNQDFVVIVGCNPYLGKY